MNITNIINLLLSRTVLRGVIAIAIFITIWEVGARSEELFGYRWPFLGLVPPPTDVFASWGGLIGDPSYWQSWYMSFLRVFGGFAAAMVIGIPLGLFMAVNKTFYGMYFPTFEKAAQSMGASQWDIFRRIVLPATLPSIVVGSAVGMGITWEVVVAAEMISGGGSSGGGAGGGLGFFIWSSYVGGSYEQIVVGMISIGIAGYFSSELLRQAGGLLTPWLKTR